MREKLIICGKLFDGIHDDLQEKMEILIEGNVIKEVGKNLSYSSGAEVIDLSELTVTPGMIDAHVHTDILDWREYWQNIPLRSDAFYTLSHLHTAMRSLERGFTTVRAHSAAPSDYGIADVKKMINRGAFAGARLNITCHLLGTPGSHCDNGQSLAGNPNYALRTQSPHIGSGADFFRNAVRNEVKFGSDFIKLFLSGGFSTPNDGPEDQQMCDEEIEAVISTARALRKPTTAHVYAPHLMQKLIHYGITGMEHGALMDEETARMFEETDTYLVPTFCPYDDVIAGDEASLKKKTPEFREKLIHYGKWLKEGRKIIIDSKIRLGYGTDLVAVDQCYEGWREYQSWMDSGMEPFRILKAATSVNAEILQMNRYIGTIEPGKYADIAGWHRDLLTDPKALSQCDFVMKDGIVYPTVYAEKEIEE